MNLRPAFAVLCLLTVSALVFAQQPKPAGPAAPRRPAALVTPDVHSDHSVTFRFRAPNARQVKLAREGAEPLAMQKNADGVWSVTTAPLAPDYYGYSILVDDVRILDPFNPRLVPNLLASENAVYIPGGGPWDATDAPHGVVHHHFYKSAVANDERDYYVYTPAGYDPAAKKLIRCCTCCTASATTPAGGPPSDMQV